MVDLRTEQSGANWPARRHRYLEDLGGFGKDFVTGHAGHGKPVRGTASAWPLPRIRASALPIPLLRQCGTEKKYIPKLSPAVNGRRATA